MSGNNLSNLHIPHQPNQVDSQTIQRQQQSRVPPDHTNQGTKRAEKSSLQKVHAEERAAEAEQNRERKDGEKEGQKERLEDIKNAANDLLARMNIKLDFNLDKQTEEIVVKIRNKENNEVIRQIPPEEMLELAKRMEEMSGILLDQWS